MKPRTLELLAPARDCSVGISAILAGADAVYIGAPAFGARSAATNSVADIATLVSFAHTFRTRVYVTMNTILFDSELEEARKLVHDLYRIGVDALIVQDMAYLMMDIPPIALHASTQCDIRTPQKAAWLAGAGFSQLVLPREFTLQEIRTASEAAGIPVEVFVHGALCVSYSGDCQAGFVAMGRSANRGVCPQMCRLPYELTDTEGNNVAPRKHYLSLRDMNRSSDIASLVEAGASSFKIEGRLKDARYVANVTAAYSRILDDIVEKSEGQFARSSAGKCRQAFTPDLRRTFNRSYTSYFLHKPTQMASIDTPKWAGMPVGMVASAYDRRHRCFRASLTENLANGDGLGFFSESGNFIGFRLNRADGQKLYPASELPELRPGMKLYRNNDKAFFEILDRKDACSRKLQVDFSLRALSDGRISITAKDSRGCSTICNFDCPDEEARSPQRERRADILAKLGDTIYEIGDIDDSLGMRFVPASVLATARRDVLQVLANVAEASYPYDRRHVSTLTADAFAGMPPTSYHDNIANSLAEEFYRSHGAVIGDKAIEIEKPSENEICVMTTKYCLRRELGACLKEKNARTLPSPLFLSNESGRYRLDFDCARCGMKVIKVS